MTTSSLRATIPPVRDAVLRWATGCTAAALLACGPVMTPVGSGGGGSKPIADMATSSTSYCGSAGKSKLWQQDCTLRCVPDEPVFFYCTEKMGRLAYTRAGLKVPQQLGYSWESSGKCQDSDYLVWRLVPIARPSNVDVGKMSYSTTYADCSRETLHPPFIDNLTTNLFYRAEGPVEPIVIQ